MYDNKTYVKWYGKVLELYPELIASQACWTLPQLQKKKKKKAQMGKKAPNWAKLEMKRYGSTSKRVGQKNQNLIPT